MTILTADERHEIRFTLNGREVVAAASPRTFLADLLRHGLGATGTHVGCEHGVCGACTVLVDGAAVRSCLMLAVQADGAAVTTVEGLARPDGTLHPLQTAFWEHHGLQCGFCTPGMLTSLAAYLEAHPNADEPDIRRAISGNICRCTGYQNIVAAALDAARVMREGR